MNKTLSEYVTIASTAARAAGQIMREGWGKPHALEFKGAINLVTEVDRAAEAVILEHLRCATPDYDVLAEESGTHARGCAFRWVIDPLDGTTNYAHHFPYFAVSIGLEENGESIAGVVYDPLRDELFTATRGGGAFLNGERIACSHAQSIGESLIAAGFVYDVWESDRGLDEMLRLIKRARSVRINGSAALDYANIACGRLDAYCDTGLFPWDISAGRLLVTEAGGIFKQYGDTSRTDLTYCIASNAHIHAELEKLLMADGR
ncbi:MAG: inositol monophosphatase [Chloroflexi bacterium]|nr:inositol monophosphatase [Chloroflexota bacterium]